MKLCKYFLPVALATLAVPLAALAGSTSQRSSLDVKTGTVQATLTWQYNDVIGSKGDSGAVLLLFREPCKHKLTVNDVATLKPQFVPWSYRTATPSNISLSTRRSLRSFGIYEGEADGSGSAIINDVPIGHYIVLGLSKSTHRTSEANDLSEDVSTTLSPLFASNEAFSNFKNDPGPPPSLHIGFMNPFVDEIAVKADGVTMLSHDFGHDEL